MSSQEKLPETLRSLFWDCDFDQLTWEEHRDFVTGRVLSAGPWDAVCWLRRQLGDAGLREWILRREGRGLDSRQLRFWELVLGLPSDQVDTWLRDEGRRIREGRVAPFATPECSMNDEEMKRGLAVRIISVDDDLIELACRIVYGKFAGESTCYTSSPQLHDFADELSQFCLNAEGQPTFNSGLSDGVNACDLQVYMIDMARHMAVHVRMATDRLTPRPQSIARLELEMIVEPWSLSQFADQLRNMAQAKTGEALLTISDVVG